MSKYFIDGIKKIFNSKSDASLILSSIIIKNDKFSKSINLDKIRDKLIKNGYKLNVKVDDKLINKVANDELVLNYIKEASEKDIEEINNAKVSIEDLPSETDSKHVHNELNPYGLHRHEFKTDLTGAHSHPEGFHYHYLKSTFDHIEGGAHTHSGSKNKFGEHTHDLENSKKQEELINNEGSIENGDEQNGYPVILMKSGLASSGHYYPPEVMQNSKQAFTSGKRPLRAFLNHASKEERMQGIRHTENICGIYKNIAVKENGNIHATFFPTIGTPAGDLAKSLLDNSTSIVDVSTVVMVGYRNLTNDEKAFINNDNAKFMIEEIAYCASCDLVPDGGAGGEFIEIVQNAGYCFDNKGIIIKNVIENNGGVNQLDLTLDKLKTENLDLYNQIVKNAKAEVINDLEDKGQEEVFKTEINNLKLEIESNAKTYEEELEKSNEKIKNAIAEKNAAEDKLKVYENTVLANKIVEESIPTLDGKQKTYIIKQIKNCESEEDMVKMAIDFKETFGDSLKKNPVTNNGGTILKENKDKDIIDDLENLISIKELFNDISGINEDGKYNSIKPN